MEAVVGPEEVKLVVASLLLRESGHELAAILCDEQGSQFHDLQILGADVGHTRRELKIRGFRGPGGFLVDRDGSLAHATGRYCGTTSFLDFA